MKDDDWNERVMQLVSHILKSVGNISRVDPGKLSESRKILLKILDDYPPVSPAESSAISSTNLDSPPPQASSLLESVDSTPQPNHDPNPPQANPSSASTLLPRADYKSRPNTAHDQVVLLSVGATQTPSSDSGAIVDDKCMSHVVDSYASSTSTLCSDDGTSLACATSDADINVNDQGKLKGRPAVTKSFPRDSGWYGNTPIDLTLGGFQPVDSEVSGPYDTVLTVARSHGSYDRHYHSGILGDSMFTGTNDFIPHNGSTAATFVGELNSHVEVPNGSGDFSPFMPPMPEAQYSTSSYRLTPAPILFNNERLPIVQAPSSHPMSQLCSPDQAYLLSRSTLPPVSILPSYPESLEFSMRESGNTNTDNVMGPSTQPSGIARAPFSSRIGRNSNTAEGSRKNATGPERALRRKVKKSTVDALDNAALPIRCNLHGCPTPEMVFMSKTELLRHQRTTLGHADRQFQCVHCGLKYTRQDAMKRHVRKTHGQSTDA